VNSPTPSVPRCPGSAHTACARTSRLPVVCRPLPPRCRARSAREPSVVASSHELPR
jgi:hypothetical protein